MITSIFTLVIEALRKEKGSSSLISKVDAIRVIRTTPGLLREEGESSTSLLQELARLNVIEFVGDNIIIKE